MRVPSTQPNVYMPPWSDAAGWSSPSYYATMQAADVNGDGKAELLGRSSAGIQTWGLNAALAVWQQLATGDCGFTDDNGWNQAPYYATIQCADIDGDGQAELMGRGEYGIDTWKWDTGTSAWVNLATGDCGFTDQNNWNQPQCYATIQCADIDGDGQAELLGRGEYGIDTWKWDTATSAWVNLATGDCGFTDDNGWNQAPYYATIQCADIDGDGQAELLGRGKYGIDTWKWDTATSAWVNVSTAQGDFTDANGWNTAPYYATIQCADVNGDGRAELLGRFSPGVETVAFDAATGGWQPIGPLISVDARLMENYVLATPAAAAGQYEVVANAVGELEVLTIGADGNVYEIYPDPASDTGYSQVPVGVSATQLAAGLTDEGLLLVLAAGDGTLSYVLSAPASSATRWNAAATLPSLSGQVDDLAAARIGSHLYVAALAGVTTGSQTTYTAYLAQWSSAGPSLGSGTVAGPLPSAPAAVTALGPSRDTFQTPTYWVMWGSAVWGLTLQGGTELNPQGPSGAAAVGVMAIADGGGLGHLYAVFSNGALCECPTGLAWLPMTGELIATVSGALNAQTSQVELYAAGQDARLRQILPAATVSVLDLGIPATAARVGVDGDGQLTTFAAANAVLTSVWQSADTSDWSTSTVDVSALGQLQPVTTYTAELTIRDDLGLPRAYEPVTIVPSDPVLLTVNGVTTWVDAENPLATAADARGKVSVMTPTASLSAPLLLVTPGFVSPGSGVVVELNGAVQARLRGVGPDDLLNPVDTFGDPLSQPLLPGVWHNEVTATGLAQTVTQGMTLVTPPADGSATSRIDRTRVPEQHWRLRLGPEGTAQFTRLTEAEARSMITAHRASLEAGGIFDIDWGAGWEAVREGAGKLTDLMLSVVADGITVAATWVVDGVTSAFNGLIELIEQAFDIIEGVFEAIGTAFSTLVEWLGFLFDWTDISRTAQAVSFLYAQCLELLPGTITWMQTELTNSIDQYGSQLAQLFDNLAASVSGQHDTVTLSSSVGPPPSELGYSHANNVLLTGTLNNAGSATSISSTTSRALDPSPIGELIQQLETYADQFEAGDGFSNALAYFQQMAQQLPNEPGQALRSALAGMIEVLSGMTQLALETVSLVVNAVLGTLSALIEAVSDAVQLQWEIPFVSQLYQYVTGTTDPLTPIGLAALLVAIPATVFSKLTTGAAPFADDAALAQFQSTFTAQAVLQSLPTAGAVATAGPPAEFYAAGLLVLYNIGLVSQGMFYDLSAIADVTTIPPIQYDPSVLQILLSGAIMITESVAVVYACPVWALTSPSVVEWFAWGFCAVLPVALDSAWFVYLHGIPQLSGNEGVMLSFLMGVIALIMTAIWLFIGLATGHAAWLHLLAAFLGALPLIFKPLRLLSIENATVGPVPVKPWNRCALALIDTLAGNGSAIAAYQASVSDLNQDSSTAAAFA